MLNLMVNQLLNYTENDFQFESVFFSFIREQIDRIRPVCLPLISEGVQERNFVGQNPFVGNLQ